MDVRKARRLKARRSLEIIGVPSLVFSSEGTPILNPQSEALTISAIIKQDEPREHEFGQHTPWVIRFDPVDHPHHEPYQTLENERGTYQLEALVSESPSRVEYTATKVTT